jgi:ABC-type phosphate transport system substrate-binding protein
VGDWVLDNYENSSKGGSIMKHVMLSLLILVSTPSLTGFTAPEWAVESISIIVNNNNPVVTLSAGEVKLYYTRKIKKRWPILNKNIRPADRRNKCQERDAFYSGVLGMKDDEVNEYFINKQLQNAERPQDKFGNEADLINFVAEEPGAIGYIKTSSITPEVRARVKVVLTF